MRILYGVVGEGMGHAIRSRVILDELTRHHEVLVVVSGRAHAYLEEALRHRMRLQKIWGLNIVYEDNEVRRFRTLLANARGAIRGWPANVRAYFDVARSFEPDVVVSDFESWSQLFARRHRLPVISVDNIQVIDRCTHPPEILEGHRTDFQMTRQLVRRKVPGALHYHITTFFRPPVSRPRTTLHPPVLRPRILEAVPEDGDHLLVYQTSTTNTRLPALLRDTGLPCRIYGLRRDLEADEVDGSLLWRPFDEATFVDDLRTARGVVSSAGFTLMGEALHLGRPLL
ncbi:MAG: teichoic acid biosynthesis protein, partial [Gemmatimonadales bacterium]